ncbi:MAG TPA: tRNA pseudouridine(55) synthase TruB [Gemmatimonadaceae bacterium]|nr:tRNA pseudouridine(55) synthase TruB [Gemmatimonadaceae bacterium]
MTRRRASPESRVDGLLLVDKPAGVSSHDVVSVARRAVGERQLGHGGTLDPFATGLLVLLLGRATRLLTYLHDEPKVYEATVRFGAETDTEDLGGTVVRHARLPSRAALLDVLPRFHGDISQVPPAYSAKRVAGRRAYEIAREGGEVELTAVPVHIAQVALDEFEECDGGVAACRMRVTCGGGTYVRSLARDIARAAGTAAHLVALRRHRAGVFDLSRAAPFEALRERRVAVLPAVDAVEGHAAQLLASEEIAQVTRGIDVEARVPGAFAALLDGAAPSAATQLVAFAERRPAERGDRWQPRVVLRDR